MKRSFLIKLAGIIGMCMANQTFTWVVHITNRTSIQQFVEVVYPGCSDDQRHIDPGETVDIDAKGCLVTEIKVHKYPQKPYTSSGQSTYNYFNIVGPINGFYHVVRFE